MTFFLFLLLPFSSQALSDEELARHVLGELPTIEAAREDLRSASANITTQLGNFDAYIDGRVMDVNGDYDYQFLQSRVVKPTSLLGLDLYAGFRRSNGLVPNYYGELETLSSGEWSVGFKLPLLQGLVIDERRAAVQKSTLREGQRRLQLRTVELEQLRDSLHKYWDWRLAQQKVNVYQNLLDIALNRDKWLEKRHRSGDLSRFERNDNRRSILQRQSVVMQNQQSLTQYTQELLAFITDPQLMQKSNQPATDVTLPPQVLQFTENPDNLVERALTLRPDLRQYDNQVEQLAVDQRLQRNRYLPKLDLEAQMSQDEGTGGDKLGDRNSRISLEFQVPLQYRKISGSNAQIEADISRARQLKRALEMKIKAEIVAYQQNLQVTLKRHDLALEEYKLASEIEKGEASRLRHGESNIFILNLREQTTAEAHLRVLETAVEAIKIWVSLKTAVGELPIKN